MAPTTLAHGMGTAFKECGHDPAYWPRCPHPYKIRYRNAMGRQQQESGFTSREAAITRLVAIYNERKTTPANQTRTERIAKYGPMTFHEYTREWKQGQRHLAPASLLHLDSLLEHHIFKVGQGDRLFPRDVCGAFQADHPSPWGRACTAGAGTRRGGPRRCP